MAKRIRWVNLFQIVRTRVCLPFQNIGIRECIEVQAVGAVKITAQCAIRRFRTKLNQLPGTAFPKYLAYSECSRKTQRRFHSYDFGFQSRGATAAPRPCNESAQNIVAVPPKEYVPHAKDIILCKFKCQKSSQFGKDFEVFK